MIDTSNFVKDGLTNITSKIRYLIDRFRLITNCVILFDKIEVVCLDLDCEAPGLSMESRLLTTSMLMKLNNF